MTQIVPSDSISPASPVGSGDDTLSNLNVFNMSKYNTKDINPVSIIKKSRNKFRATNPSNTETIKNLKNHFREGPPLHSKFIDFLGGALPGIIFLLTYSDSHVSQMDPKLVKILYSLLTFSMILIYYGYRLYTGRLHSYKTLTYTTYGYMLSLGIVVYFFIDYLSKS